MNKERYTIPSEFQVHQKASLGRGIQSKYSDTRRIYVKAKGEMLINKRLIEEIGGPLYVTLWVNHKKTIVLIIPSTVDEINAYKLSGMESKDAGKVVRIAAKRFAHENRMVIKDCTVSYPVSIDSEGKIVVRIDTPDIFTRHEQGATE